MIKHSRTEQVILEMDKLANEDYSYKVSKNEIEFYRGNWWLHSNVARDDTMTTSTHLKNGMTAEDNTGKPVF